ncbi:kunitz-type serine protease inhibitor nigrescinin-2 [Plakobranchus ocellatus]|uniref:Kunitz-type serine protease inhibitor nigrescinin-2 n=1 Tax=Plakobranchus ocellatus TaxID=259542 RepID=A0AAV4AFH3_9GAST|nr:kunitz-type serine protease inhibitor nigrescinin-2 [Plakobranchus ocellatus]
MVQGAEWCRVQNGAEGCRRVQGAEWCRMVQKGAEWCRMVQKGAGCRMVQNGAEGCRVQNDVTKVNENLSNLAFVILSNIILHPDDVRVGQKQYSDYCVLPPETGPCKGLFHKVYFDAKDATCKDFVYGGCLGNKNNFATARECMEACSDVPIAVPAVG